MGLPVDPWRGLPAVGAIKKRRSKRGVFSIKARSNYFETDFLNMRSIFSLVASHEACAACAADSAWLAVLCAPLAAVEACLAAACAALAARAAESADADLLLQGVDLCLQLLEVGAAGEGNHQSGGGQLHND